VYAQVDEVRTVLARDPSQYANTAASLDDAAITGHIASAQAQVDGRLSGRYTVPFPADAVPQLVVDITRDIAAYLADLTYRQGLDYETDRDPVVLRYQQAMQMLGQIAAGQIDLPVEPGTSETGGLLTARNRYNGDLFGLSDFGLGVRDGW
jgi:phage gp36-like protein